MISKWSKTKLSAICRLNYGKALSKDDRVAGVYPVVGSAGTFGWHTQSNVSTDVSIIIGRKGTAGSVTWFDSPVWATDTCYWVQPIVDIDARFLFHALEAANLPSLCAQTGVPGLSRDRAYATDIALPTLTEQRRVVDLMWSVDNAIAAVGDRTSALFVVKSNLTSSLLQPSAGGARLVPLKEVMSLDIRKVKVTSGIDYPLAGVLNRGRGLLSRESVNASTTKYLHLNRVLPGQVVYSKLKAFEGAITVVPSDAGERYASVEFPTFTCGADLLPEFFRLKTTQPDFWEHMALRSKGMGGRRERLNPDDFLSLELSLPAVAEQQKAVSLVSAVELSYQESEKELTALRNFRSELLSALLSGAHRIPETYDELMGA